jgi:hypothetical protein
VPQKIPATFFEKHKVRGRTMGATTQMSLTYWLNTTLYFDAGAMPSAGSCHAVDQKSDLLIFEQLNGEPDSLALRGPRPSR